MIGYYVHHVGAGHLHRAEAVAAHLGAGVTVLSSLPRPYAWPYEWVDLPRDDDGDDAREATAGGLLHWAPLHDAGLRRRSAVVSRWIIDHDPDVLVVDVSVEVAALARLHGVPVVVVAQPGTRDDPVHQLAFGLADAIVAPWPDLDPSMSSGLSGWTPKVTHVGGVSRCAGRPVISSPVQVRTVLALGGRGGHGPRRPDTVPAGWNWLELTGPTWVDDPWRAICAADVVVSHCGLGAIADIATARRPAVLIPELRPHGEQVATARGLRAAGIATVLDAEPDDWTPVLDAAVSRGGEAWSAWSDGQSAERFAAVVLGVTRRSRSSP